MAYAERSAIEVDKYNTVLNNGTKQNSKRYGDMRLYNSFVVARFH